MRDWTHYPSPQPSLEHAHVNGIGRTAVLLQVTLPKRYIFPYATTRLGNWQRCANNGQVYPTRPGGDGGMDL